MCIRDRCGHLVVLDWLGHDSWFVMHLLRQSMSENVLTSLFGGKMCFGCLFFMLSEAELALLDALVCPNALALWGAVRSMMLVLADVRVYESGVAWWSLWAGWLWIDGWLPRN